MRPEKVKVIFLSEGTPMGGIKRLYFCVLSYQEENSFLETRILYTRGIRGRRDRFHRWSLLMF